MEFMSTFEVPAFARALVAEYVSPSELLLIEGLASREFSAADAAAALESATGEKWPASQLDPVLQGAYRHGVLELVDEGGARFRVSTFYDWLGVFVVAQPAEYLALPPDMRAQLDAWFFESYLSALGEEDAPTGDRVLSLAETLEHIDLTDRQIWLNPCDCRILAGHCELPVETCVTFRNGINTLSHRGWSKPLTKDEAKAVVRRADADGLMHTANDGGICNCCSDCCYLFRAQQARGTGSFWPRSEKIVAFDSSACSTCGLCVERCPFDAFAWDGDEISFDPSRCRGCGLCAETCPASAIEMALR